MPYTIKTELHIEVAPDVAFDTLADHDSWPEWMPRSFRPVGPSMGTLRVGMVPVVRISGFPFATPLPVRVVDRPREITWEGRTGPLNGSHSFLFEPHGGGTRVRSLETWSGWLAWVLWPVLRPGAVVVGNEQLAGIRKGALARRDRAGLPR